MKYQQKKIDGNRTRVIGAVLKKSWKQYPFKKRLYGKLPPILQIIQMKQARTKSWGKFSNGFPYIDQPVLADLQKLQIDKLCNDTRSSLVDLPSVITPWWWCKTIKIAGIFQPICNRLTLDQHLQNGMLRAYPVCIKYFHTKEKYLRWLTVGETNIFWKI